MFPEQDIDPRHARRPQVRRSRQDVRGTRTSAARYFATDRAAEYERLSLVFRTSLTLDPSSNYFEQLGHICDLL